MGNDFKVWMSQTEIDMIESYLKPESLMLEWGCGGSTFHFSQFVEKYYSIEHHEKWFGIVKPETSGRNISLHFVAGLPQGPGVWPDGNNYGEYVRYPLNFGLKFDAVLVDGRQRSDCLNFTADKLLREDSVVFIHDFWRRSRYHEAVRTLYNIIDFVSKGQSLAVLKKKKI